ncbi:monocarboxylate transporter 12-like [Diadema setosum]|uniref:monocarboxylate transporter 12-like n=1 Tax=Diadema setosum TaxID=31175 RepID=UPI003B3A3A17
MDEPTALPSSTTSEKDGNQHNALQTRSSVAVIEVHQIGINKAASTQRTVTSAAGTEQLTALQRKTPTSDARNNDAERASPRDSATSRHLDGGWAWVIMMAALLTHMLTFGLTYAMVGVFHVELLAEFGRSDSETAWTGSTLLGTMLFVGPISSILVGKFGARAIAIAGGVLSGTGLALSALAPSLDYLFFTYGALTGFGFGLSYLPCIVMVGRFFEKRRSVATGFVVAGSGIGTFVFSPTVQIIIDRLGWRHGFLALGTMELALCLCGATYRPSLIPERPSSAEYQRRLLELEEDHKKDVEDWGVNDMEGRESLFSLGSFLTLGSSNNVPGGGTSKNVSVVDFTASKSTSKRESALSFVPGKDLEPMSLRIDEPEDTCAAEETRTLTEILPYTAAMDIFSHRIQSATTIAVPESVHAESRCARFISPFYKIFLLLKNRFLVLFALSNFVLCIGYQLPYVYFKSFALQLGVGADEWSFILSVMGITDMLGRIFVGFVFDRILGKHRRMIGYVTSCVLAGMMLCIVPLASNYLSLSIIASLFALIAGSTDSLTPALLVAFVGLDTLGYSFGLVIEMQGAGFFVGPPIAGALYGVFGDYAAVFCTGGMAFMFAGLIMLLEPCLGGKVNLSKCRRSS